MKTIYISGPITDLTTGQPRKGWQQDFLDAEVKLRLMGFSVINPIDIARDVEDEFLCNWEYLQLTKEPKTPSRADYIMACLNRMKVCDRYGRLDGVYVIGEHIAALMSHGVQMEILMADVLGLPIYAECRDGLCVDRGLIPIEGHGKIEELLKED